MTKSEIIQKLEQRLIPQIYRHSIATGEMAEKLARLYHVDEQKAFLAGVLHDCAKDMSKKELLAYAKSHGIPIDTIQEKQPGLLHGAVASNIAKTEFDIDDEEILHAIEVHSTGSKKMSLLDKILYVSDSAEPNRDYEGVEMIRNLIFNGELDNALLEGMKIKLIYVIEKKVMLHPDSIEAWNEIAGAFKEKMMNK
jgi:predicted HD superfamily hydrolase involved in NAD metabolism